MKTICLFSFIRQKGKWRMKLITQYQRAQAAVLEPKDWKLWQKIEIESLRHTQVAETVIQTMTEVTDQYCQDKLRTPYMEHLVFIKDGVAVGRAILDTYDNNAMIDFVEILAPYRGQGLGNFAYKACVKFAKDLQLEYIQADILPSNEPSTKAALKNGFNAITLFQQKHIADKSYTRYRLSLDDTGASLDLPAL
jgi:RimJ/RimL family protein N-acetyltransferase